MIKLFCGYDPRESIGFHVFVQSVIARASEPVEIIPLAAMGLPHGSNAFSLSRFLTPHLMEYKGHAIFCDASDMLMVGDVAELDALFDPQYAVQVVKHPDYQTKHRTKYRGTDMECPNFNYPRKNWASVMLMNCEHRTWDQATPKRLAEVTPKEMLQMDFCQFAIGEIPDCWNRLVDEGQEVEGAKLLHWTAGMPAFEHYRCAPGAEHWHAERAVMERTA